MARRKEPIDPSPNRPKTQPPPPASRAAAPPPDARRDTRPSTAPAVATPPPPKPKPITPVTVELPKPQTPAIPSPIESAKRAPEIPKPPITAPLPAQPPRAETPVPTPPPMARPTEPSAPSLSPSAPTPSPAPAPPQEQPPLLFECGWEVCWQLGGIYTVLRTKAPAMLDRWGDRYFMIGPYNPSTAAVEFEERPTEGFIRQALDKLRDAGVPCHYGRWLIPGRPRVILLDYRARYASLGQDKYYLWKDHGIPTVDSDGEVNDVVAFGFTVAEFFRHLASVVTDRRILAHFHEWMGGVAVPRIAHTRLPVTTVFTTHATLLGRYLASDDPNFYSNLPHLNPDERAGHYQIYPRFAIERSAAHASTVFTTVSEVTAVEAEKLLGRTADMILPNGLNIQKFEALHEFQHLHRQYKERIHEFVMGHFFPSYSFDLDRTLYLFTSGRYEYLNKGMDLYLEAMHRLNQRLKGVPNPPTVISFIITKAAVRNINVGALQNQSMFEELKSTCQDLERHMGRRLFMAAATGRVPTAQEILPDEAQVRLKRTIHAWRTPRQPSIVTHDLADDAGDPVLKHLRHRHLFNAADDPVKMIFHPQFVTATGPLISLDYEQFVRGCHLGIFPSYYEPWGYTPMECAALGVPAVTTDLSGFGAYLQRHIQDHEDSGLAVLNRRTKSFEQCADDLADYLFKFVQLNRRQRIALRNKVERMSELFDWSILAQHYHEAHHLALERTSSVFNSGPGKFEIRVV